MKIIGLVSGIYNNQIPNQALLEQMIQYLLDYPESGQIRQKLFNWNKS
jgi:hypothetical protein